MVGLEKLHHLHHRHDGPFLLGADSDFVHLRLAASRRAMDCFVAVAVQRRGHYLAATGEAFALFSGPPHGAAKNGFLPDGFSCSFYPFLFSFHSCL